MKLFSWTRPLAERALNALLASGELVKGVEIDDQPGEWYGLKRLVE